MLDKIKELREEANKILETSQSEYAERSAKGDEEALTSRRKAADEALVITQEADALYASHSLNEKMKADESKREIDDSRIKNVMKDTTSERSEIDLSSDEYLKAWHETMLIGCSLRTGYSDERLSKRAQTIANDSEGGFAANTMPLPAVGQLLYTGPMLDGNVINIVETGSASNETPIPFVNYTSQNGTNRNEGTAHGAGTDLTFSEKTLVPETYTSGFVTLSKRVFENASSLRTFVQEELAKAAIRGWNNAMTTGAGTGFAANNEAATGKTSAQKSDVIISDIVDLIYSVNYDYRVSPKARFMANDAIIARIAGKQISTSDQRFVLQPAVGAQPGDVPMLVLGQTAPVRVSINNSMSSTFGARAKIAAYGDFGKYYVRVDTMMGGNNGVATEAIKDTTSAPNTAVAAFIIGAGKLADQQAVKVLQQSA